MVASALRLLRLVSPALRGLVAYTELVAGTTLRVGRMFRSGFRSSLTVCY